MTHRVKISLSRSLMPLAVFLSLLSAHENRWNRCLVDLIRDFFLTCEEASLWGRWKTNSSRGVSQRRWDVLEKERRRRDVSGHATSPLASISAVVRDVGLDKFGYEEIVFWGEKNERGVREIGPRETRRREGQSNNGKFCSFLLRRERMWVEFIFIIPLTTLKCLFAKEVGRRRNI